MDMKEDQEAMAGREGEEQQMDTVALMKPLNDAGDGDDDDQENVVKKNDDENVTTNNHAREDVVAPSQPAAEITAPCPPPTPAAPSRPILCGVLIGLFVVLDPQRQRYVVQHHVRDPHASSCLSMAHVSTLS